MTVGFRSVCTARERSKVAPRSGTSKMFPGNASSSQGVAQ